MDARILDLGQLEALLAAEAGRPLLVHHFATWCEPCEAEMPHLADLLDLLGDVAHTSIAVAWDRFLAPFDGETLLAQCRAFLGKHGVPFDRLVVYVGEPEELFRSQAIGTGTVPFTEVRDAAGKRVAAFPEPLLERAAQERLLAAVRGAAS